MGVLNRLCARNVRVWPEYWEQGVWSLLHDNAPAHICKIVRDFLAKIRIMVLDHSPYSPDLAPCDFWLLPKSKLATKGKRFDTILNIKTASAAMLKAIPKNEFQKCLKKCTAASSAVLTYKVLLV